MTIKLERANHPTREGEPIKKLKILLLPSLISEFSLLVFMAGYSRSAVPFSL